MQIVCDISLSLGKLWFSLFCLVTVLTQIIHFAWGLLSLGYQKNIKAGSIWGKYLQVAVIALWPPHPLHSVCLNRQGESSMISNRVSRPPSQWNKKQTRGGKSLHFKNKNLQLGDFFFGWKWVDRKSIMWMTSPVSW